MRVFNFIMFWDPNFLCQKINFVPKDEVHTSSLDQSVHLQL